jgi:hypothetical protein
MSTNRGYGDASTLSDGSISGSLLPDQYFDRAAVRASDSPEKRLMFAVLLDAVIHLQRRGTQSSAEADRWIRGRHSESPFSFKNVREALGIDSSYLRRGLLIWDVDRTSFQGVARSLQRRRLRGTRVGTRARRRRPPRHPRSA